MRVSFFFVFFVFVFVFVPFFADAARAGDADIVSVDVVGEVVPVGDAAQIEAAARRDARRRAVEQLLSQHPLVQQRKETADELVTTTRGWAVDEVFAPLVRGERTATVRLRARYDVAVLTRSLCAAVRAAHDPKVTVLVDDDSAATAPLRARVAAAFAQLCFTVLTNEVPVALTATGGVSEATVRAVTRDSLAQSVVWVTTSGTTPTARLWNTGTDELEGISPMTLEGTGVERGVLELAKQAWQRFDSGCELSSPRVQVRVNGPVDRRGRQALLQLFHKLGFTAVEREHRRDQTTFDVDVDGGAELLAERSDGKAAGARTVEIIEVSRGKVILRLTTTSAPPPK